MEENLHNSVLLTFSPAFTDSQFSLSKKGWIG